MKMIPAGRRNGPRRRSTALGTDLLGHAAADLGDCQIVRRTARTAVVTPPIGSAFEVEVRRERRKLIDLHVLAVHVDGPATADEGAAIVFHHRGQLRRTGLAGRIRGRDDGSARALHDRLVAGDALEDASLKLDFTRFEVRPHAGCWRATLELMGASHVRTLFPPSSHYVRLDGEQRTSLLATIAVLQERLPGRAPITGSSDDRSQDDPQPLHLPRRTV